MNTLGELDSLHRENLFLKGVCVNAYTFYIINPNEDSVKGNFKVFSKNYDFWHLS